MKLVCKKDMCVGCAACINACPQKCIEIQDSILSLNAVIDEERCVGCLKCKKVCQQNNHLELKEQIFAVQGWTKNATVRKKSASGGIATAISHDMIEKGGYVCSCVFEKGKFIFSITNSQEKVSKFAGSKYVKSMINEAYSQVRNLLQVGKMVLFIGLPCQVAGLYLYLEHEYDKLYTVDLICHGTPSEILLKKYLSEHGCDIYCLEEIQFRSKDEFRLNNGIKKRNTADRFIYSFLEKLNFFECCYQCHYAKKKRVGDLTLGDSWGSEIKHEISGGISLILCQTLKGKELLESTNLSLHPVNLERAIQYNEQLLKPSYKSFRRKLFFDLLKTGLSYDKIFFVCSPFFCLKQDIKYLLNIIGGRA